MGWRFNGLEIRVIRAIRGSHFRIWINFSAKPAAAARRESPRVLSLNFALCKTTSAAIFGTLFLIAL